MHVRCGLVGVRPPSGTVTFLFTDVVGSTELWERVPDAMAEAIARHDALLHAVIEAHDGYVFATAGDGVAAAFARAGDAMRAAVAAQEALATERWPNALSLSVRMGLHSGEADERDGGFFGAAVNRAARIMSVARGGQILLSAVAAGLGSASVTGIELRPVGSRRLRGVSEPVDVVVVSAGGLDTTPPPADVVEGRLPRPMTEYVGDLAELRRRVGRLSGQRLVTLTGSGGVGKTRTALEIGWLSTDEFPGGVWLVELAPLGLGDAVPAAVAATLGARLQPGSTMTESIVAWLGERPTLLILDNCEHVLDAAAALVAAIEGGAPATTVLATSREPLGLAGEIVRRVPSLDPATDAVQLFAERAVSTSDGFVLEKANRGVIAAICARLDGIPLAIELAAARVPALSPSEILARLDDRFRLLRSSGRGGHERHQTLLAAVTWSVRLLSPQERCLFERLSVFAGSFSLADVEAVCGFVPLDQADVVDLLSALVGRSIVNAEPAPDNATRYRLLETMRQYGEQALAADPAGTARMRDRHLAHFLLRAEHWYAQQSTAREPESNKAFAANWDNLRAAFDWALATGRGRDVADLLHTTYWFAFHAGRWEHREWAVAVVAADSDTGRIANAAVAVWGVSVHFDAPAETRAALDPSAPDLVARDIEQVWLARANTAFLTNDREELDRAADWLREAEPRCGDPITEAWLLANLINGTLSAPDPELVARLQRLAQTTSSPSVQAIAGFTLHGGRYLNPELGEGLDLGDIVGGLQDATRCSRATGNLYVETVCMVLAAIPLSARGERRDAPDLRAIVNRIHELRYELGLNLFAPYLAIWLVHVGRPDVASVVDGWLRNHNKGPIVPPREQAITQLEQLLDGRNFIEERSRGAAMTSNDLTDFLDHVLTAVADQAVSAPHQADTERV
jgi:predicted ATPase/class 3 adenylate cyclase